MSHLTLDSVSEKKRGGTFIFLLKLVEFFFVESLLFCGVRFDQCDPAKFISSFPFIDKSFWIMRLNEV